MKKIHKGLVVAVSGFITMILAAGGAWAQSSTPSSSGTDSAAPTTFVEGTTNDMRTVNPWKALESPEYEVLNLNFDLLEYFNKDDLTAAPGMATNWTQSEDGLTWTFTLRDDIKWQDGEPLTANDVAFTYNKTLECELGNSLDYLVPDLTQSIKATSPTELVWTTKEPTTAPIRPPWVYIVPEHIWGGMDCDQITKATFFEDGKPMVGSGPFQLTEWNKGEDWTMTANPNYWGGAPQIDQFKVVRYDNGEAMVNALKNGEIDFANITSVDLFNQLQGDGPASGISTHVGAADYFRQMSFNMCDHSRPTPPPTAPTRGRQATRRYAIPRCAPRSNGDRQADARRQRPGRLRIVGQTVVPPSPRVPLPADRRPGDRIRHHKSNRILDDAGYADTDGNGIRK